MEIDSYLAGHEYLERGAREGERDVGLKEMDGDVPTFLVAQLHEFIHIELSWW